MAKINDSTPFVMPQWDRQAAPLPAQNGDNQLESPAESTCGNELTLPKDRRRLPQRKALAKKCSCKNRRGLSIGRGSLLGAGLGLVVGLMIGS